MGHTFDHIQEDSDLMHIHASPEAGDVPMLVNVPAESDGCPNASKCPGRLFSSSLLQCGNLTHHAVQIADTHLLKANEGGGICALRVGALAV